jgi:hypothetical protein
MNQAYIWPNLEEDSTVYGSREVFQHVAVRSRLQEVHEMSAV